MNCFRIFLKPLLGICAVVAVVFWYQGGVVVRDFVAFQAAGTMIWDTPERLYDLNEQLRVQRNLGVKDSFVPFPYPPAVALLFMPGRFLSVDGFFLTMLLGNVVLLFGGLLVAMEKLRLDRGRTDTLLLVASTAFPVYYNLIAGQLGLLSLLFYILLLVELLKGRSGKAGFWVGALAFKPTLMLIPAGLLLLRRDWANVARAALVSAALFLLGLPIVGWTAFHEQFALMRAMATNPVALRNLPAMQNLRALSHYLGLGDAGWIAATVLVLIGLAISLRREHLEKWSICAFLLASVLVPPHLHAYDLAILIVLPVLGFPVSNWYQRVYVLLGVLPLALFVLRWPIPVTPLVLFALFWLSVYRSRRNVPTDEVQINQLSQTEEVGAPN